jgi:MerR family transcriptional regulator, repressor of the yfmOP operon
LTAFPGNSYDAQVTPPETTTPPDADSVDTTVPRYQIGEVAERTGVTQRALRFYEEKGLLQPPERMEGGFRRYSDDDIVRIEFVKKLQDLLGFTLSEIKEMVESEELRQQVIASRHLDPALPARLIRAERIIDALQRQLDVVDHKADALIEMRSELRDRLEAMFKRREDIQAKLAAEEPTPKKKRRSQPTPG